MISKDNNKFRIPNLLNSESIVVVAEKGKRRYLMSTKSNNMSRVPEPGSVIVAIFVGCTIMVAVILWLDMEPFQTSVENVVAEELNTTTDEIMVHKLQGDGYPSMYDVYFEGETYKFAIAYNGDIKSYMKLNGESEGK